MASSASSVHVRRATADDLEAIGRLGALLMRVHYEFDQQRFMRPGAGAEGGYARFLGAQVDDDESLVLVAERDGQVVGYAYAAIEPQSWKELRDRAGYIHDILVDEAHRGQAIAESLMEEMFAWMREQKLPRVVLGTAARNLRAQRLFERLGFRATMVEMTKELG